MGDLKDGPEHLVFLFAFVAGVLGVFHFVLEFEERVFDVFEAVWWRFAVLGRADGGHFGLDLLSTRLGDGCRGSLCKSKQRLLSRRAGFYVGVLSSCAVTILSKVKLKLKTEVGAGVAEHRWSKAKPDLRRRAELELEALQPPSTHSIPTSSTASFCRNGGH